MARNLLAVLGGLLAVLLGLGGCAPRSEPYAQPASPAPSAWHTGLAGQEPPQAAGAPAAAELKWEDFFLDAKLRQVIQLALANNRDLRIAALNVEKLQAQYRLQRAQLFPNVKAFASSDAYRVPDDLASNGKSYTYENDRAGLQASSWELDFFGRLGSLEEQAQEQYLASEQGRTATQLSLIASVAGSYLTLAGDRSLLHLAGATLEAQKATYAMVRGARDLGMKTDLELREAQSQVESAQVDVIKYTGQVVEDENALALLVGAPVPADLLPDDLGLDQAMKDVSAGLPSEVLLRRPDIRKAEHQLKSAYANIAAARAAFFPKITLTVAGGFTSGGLSKLFSFGARTWEFAPQVSLPIFDAGALKAEHRIAQLERDSAVAEYEKAIQTAFQEVSDSLSRRARLLEKQKAQQALVNTLGETYQLTMARYRAGVDNYLNVLVAQRSLYNGQQALVGVRLSRLSNLVALYKVLGGGA